MAIQSKEGLSSSNEGSFSATHSYGELGHITHLKIQRLRAERYEFTPSKISRANTIRTRRLIAS